MKDEGVIKYKMHWKITEPLTASFLEDIIEYRNKCFQKGWIGYDEEQEVGYGNISERFSGPQFVISGSQTGDIEHIEYMQFSLVENYSFEKNELFCAGPMKASSEALTHAMFYNLSPKINAVIHIHNNSLWNSYLNKKASTQKEIPYGTVEMAAEVKRLYADGLIGEKDVLIMGGHQDGIFSWGQNFEEAFNLLESL